MSEFELRVAWSTKDYLKRHGPARTPDLGVFASYGLGGHGPLRIRRADAGTWIVPISLTERFGKWMHRILRSEALRACGWPEVDELLDKVTSVPTRTAEHGWRTKTQATLHVPLDLRLSLDQQWKELQPQLKQVQDAVLAFCGRERAFQDAKDTVTRNLYCYLLSKNVGMNATQIAHDVFPEEQPQPAAAKVRKIVSDFARALAEAERHGREK